MLSRITRQGAAVSALAVAAALLSAAGRPTPAPRGPIAPAAARDTTAVKTATLQVQNNSFSDRVISVTMGGMRERLGTAPAVTTTHFTIPASYVTNGTGVRFVADEFAGFDRQISQRVYLFPGDTVEMVIEGR